MHDGPGKNPWGREMPYKLSPGLLEATCTEFSRLASWELVTTALSQAVSTQLVFNLFALIQLCVCCEGLPDLGGPGRCTYT